MSRKVSIPRIRNVRLKAAPNVTFLRSPQHDPDKDAMLDHARTLAEWAPQGKVAGWVFVVWTEDGRHNHGFYINPDKGPIGKALAPAFVSDVLRQNLSEGDK